MTNSSLHKKFGVQMHTIPDRSSELQTVLDQKKIALWRGVQHESAPDFLQSCLQLLPGCSKPIEWDFGPVMKLIVKPDAKNYLFSREAVPMHWDGAFHVEPKYIVFYCKRAVNGFGSGPNGATLFADVERMWADLSAVERAATGQVRQRFRTEKLAHYGGDVTRNLVEDHPTKAKPVLRLAEPVSTQKNPVSLELQPEGPSTQSMVSSLHQRLYQPEYLYRHSWKAGDLLIADNHSLLHGREALSQETQREIWRVQLA